MNFFLSKKIAIAVFGVVILGVTGVVLFGSMSKKIIRPASLEPVEGTGALVNALASKDTDQDGLYDWEESLWGTDPTLADTDKDGTSDNEEVIADRNPLVPGPNDKLPQTTTAAETNDVLRTTATDLFAQKFFTDYLTLKASGLPLDEENKLNFINAATTFALGHKKTSVLSMKDVRTSKDTSDSTIESYANTIAQIFISSGVLECQNEAVIVKSALDADNEALLEELDPIIAAYRSLLSKLKLVQVPETLSNRHLQLLVSIDTLILMDEAFRNVFSDPVSAIPAVQNYQKNVDVFAQSLFAIRNAVEKPPLAYTKGDSWFELMQFNGSTE